MHRNRFRNVLRAHLLMIPTAFFALSGQPFVPGDVSTAAAQGDIQDPEAMSRQVQSHLDRAQEILDGILAVEGDRTVENTLVPMNDLSLELSAAGAKASLLENVHPDQEVREAAEKASQDVNAWVTALSLNRDVYDAVNAVDVSGADLLVRRLVTKTLRDFRRAGVDKDDATRERIKKLQEELVEIGQEFDRNIREDVRHIDLDGEEDLAGLPQDYIDSHRPDETGKIKITTRYPDYLPFMDYAKNGEARRRLYLEFKNRGYPANHDVLMKLITKRHELATLLGHDNWADYVTADKMAKSGDQAAKFIAQVDRAARERAARDYAMLLERKKKDDPDATFVGDWEKSYYQELVRAEQFDFDSQQLRSYYDYPQVKEGILDMTSKLFGVTYRKVPDAAVWHPSVECYEILENGDLLGRFFLDMHPREGKFGHAAAFPVQTGIAGKQIPMAALVCNFPGGEGEGPHLMDQDQVETFLHEFGHLLHGIFGGHQEWAEFSGIATEWDFVEAPSQMLEEWALDVNTLQTFARHYETGEPVPAELVEKLRAARDFGNGTWATQQNFYTAISLSIYNRDPEEVDLDAMVPDLEEKYGSFEHVDGTHMYANFGHLNGYSAMYYTYLWSMVIAKDLFSRFDRGNLLDPGIATEYRKKVLDPGGTKDAAELVKDFLGRSYDFESFREWLNRGAS